MSGHRPTPLLLITLTTMVLALGPLGSTAHGELAGFCNVRASGSNADFGSGNHNFGFPASARVEWDYAPGATVLPSARVLGTLYMDKLGRGCARLKVNFQDASFNNLTAPRTTEFCGPGFNANDPANQEPVDDEPFTHPLLRRVQVVVGSGPTLATVVDENVDSCRAVSVNRTVTINNGEADLGGGTLHAFGAPTAPASVSLGDCRLQRAAAARASGEDRRRARAPGPLSPCPER